MKIERSFDTIAIIGCGGVTSHILPALMMTHNLLLIDGDKFEKKNTLRQIGAHFGDSENKAKVYASMYDKFTDKKITCMETYISDMTELPDDVKILFVAVDNHDARCYAKKIAERMDIPIIWGANEEEDPEAYLFIPEWGDTYRDPYVRHNIVPDGRGPGESCNTVEAIESAPQLPIANHNAGSFMLWLFNALQRCASLENVPAEIKGTRNGVTSVRFKDIPMEAPKAEVHEEATEVKLT
jgi:molybdopterin/thiamine biosynthesis adenylyltransferase